MAMLQIAGAAGAAFGRQCFGSPFAGITAPIGHRRAFCNCIDFSADGAGPALHGARRGRRFSAAPRKSTVGAPGHGRNRSGAAPPLPAGAGAWDCGARFPVALLFRANATTIERSFSGQIHPFPFVFLRFPLVFPGLSWQIHFFVIFLSGFALSPACISFLVASHFLKWHCTDLCSEFATKRIVVISSPPEQIKATARILATFSRTYQI
jgi:hypothetical protein